jgi:HEAT repeat protein
MLPFLIDALETDEHAYSYPAAAVARVEGPDTVPAVVAVLREGKSPAAREGAIAALRIMGPKAKEAVPALLEVCNDKDGVFRSEAASALKEIDPEAAARAGVP